VYFVFTFLVSQTCDICNRSVKNAAHTSLMKKQDLIFVFFKDSLDIPTRVFQTWTRVGL